MVCSNCGKPGSHFAPPSLGEQGFFICDPADRKDCDTCGITGLLCPLRNQDGGFVFPCDYWEPIVMLKPVHVEKGGS